ncbi:hypothetical protein LJK88_18480 [Paenibacillus sp. P26]|nr:hypothetical protein LJK88_18480 [Paenibacillus sp. P26]UUZ96283.1 hypothetical protein LJK87_19350 [Paenibacillus sp. P25]
MGEHDLNHLIKDLINRNKGILTEEDFSECTKAVTDFAEIIENMEAIQTKFRRKLTEVAENHPHDKERIIYLQGLVDGIHLVVGPLKNFKGGR